MRSLAAILVLTLRQAPLADSFTVRTPAHQPRALVHVRHVHSIQELEATVADPTTTTEHEYGYDPAHAFTDSSPLSVGFLEHETELKETETPKVSVDTAEHVDFDSSIIRDLDGSPLSKDYFCRHLGIDPTTVESYTCPADSAFSGFMSNACRVHLKSSDRKGQDVATAFYKHVIFSHLSHAKEKLQHAPFKLMRDVKSYEVVTNWLQSTACKKLSETTGVRIPQLLDAKAEPNAQSPMESKFSFLFEDLAPEQGWYQQWILDDTESCQAALSTLAKIHAYFWTGSEFWTNNKNNDEECKAGQELESSVWPSGSYVQPQAQGWKQCQKVASEWKVKRMRFPEFAAKMSLLPYWDNLGQRLESVAEDCGRLAHPFADDLGPFAEEGSLSEEYNKYRTLTHGDPKQANLLFKRDDQPASDSSLQVGLIDFQWSGFGLAATDMAHFITSSVHADVLVDGGEERLQRYYHDELQKHLVEYGACASADDALEHFPWSTFLKQYDTAVLDICRLMIAYTWDRFTEPVDKDDAAAKQRTMNKTSYNKSVANVVWLMGRCDEIMKSRGV